jgi:hypothetical protein
MAGLTRSDIQVPAGCLEYGVASRQGTGRVTANLDDGLANRFSIEHGVKIDHAIHIGEWHIQEASNFSSDRLR